MAEAIISDIARFDRLTKEAAFIALRVGLRLIYIRDTSKYGTLAKFMREHFKGQQSERTLFKYIAIAEAFAKDSGLLEKKTHKLTQGEHIAPILDAQLELFTDPQAKLDGAMQKLVKWVAERGLTDLYKAKKAKPARRNGDDDNEPPSIPTAEQKAAQAEDEAADVLNLLDSWFLAGHHARVSKDTRATMDAALEEARKKLAAVK